LKCLDEPNPSKLTMVFQKACVKCPNRTKKTSRRLIANSTDLRYDLLILVKSANRMYYDCTTLDNAGFIAACSDGLLA
jgi:hypothetical protein